MSSRPLPSPVVSVDLLFALTLALGSAWLYLLTQVLELSSMQAGVYRGVFVAFAHFVVFAYLVLTLFCLYRHSTRGLSGTNSVLLLVLYTWPAALISLAVCQAFVRFPTLTRLADWGFIALFSSVFLVSCWAALRHAPLGSGGPGRIGALASVLKLAFGLAVGFVPYMMVMSMLFADVLVRSEKDFHSPGDVIHLEIRSAGYLFLPSMTEVRFLGQIHPLKESSNWYTLSLPTSRDLSIRAIEPSDFSRTLAVNFRPQLFGVELVKYQEVRFVRSD